MTRYYDLKSNFICGKMEPFSKVLSLIKITNGYPLVVVNEDNSLFGIISNGDIS